MAKRVRKSEEELLEEKIKKEKKLQSEIAQLSESLETKKTREIIKIFKSTKVYKLKTDEVNSFMEEKKEEILSFFDSIFEPVKEKEPGVVSE